jgi:hypothetical protein
MSNTARKLSLYVNEFYEACQFVHEDSYEKKALQIEHYWGRVEFAPGRGAIHLHIVAIAKNMWSFHLVEEPYIYILWL